MSYTAARDAILVHAAAAAAATDATWLDVAIGLPRPQNRCVRVWYGGEAAPVRMGANRVLNGELVAERVVLAAFWPLSTGGVTSDKAVDSEMYTFKHELRTRVLGDSQLGGAQTDLEMEYAEPDVAVIANVRYAVLEVHFLTDFTEYAIAP